jgi:EmrB/QacA subfamily drug resistance transporter
MSGINGRIVTIGLPTIAQQLHAGAVEVIWITQAYLVASTVGLLLIGRMSDMFGKVRIFSLGFLVFTIGSGLSSLALNSSQLIGFRLLQGVGSGMLLIGSSAIVTDASPKAELGTMLGINQTAFRIGNVVGLTLSGLILSVVDWRGLFYVNVPIGIFGTLWAFKRLKEISPSESSRGLDLIGFGLFSGGLALVLLGITYLSYGIAGETTGIVFLLVGLALIAIFISQESRTKSPLLDLRLFKIRLFAMGNLAQLLNSLAWGGLILVIALYLQIGLGYTPLRAGLGILPLDVTYMIMSFAAGKLSDVYGTRFLTSAGLAIITLSFFAMATFTEATQYPEIALVLVAFGIGNGMFTSPNLSAIMGSVPANRTGIASGFRNTMFNAGSTVSFGFVLLLLTFGIPYNNLSSLLQNIGPATLLALARSDFFTGYRITVLGLGIINALAIGPSIMRGSKTSLIEEHTKS